jgi:hypothetical protein
VKQGPQIAIRSFSKIKRFATPRLATEHHHATLRVLRQGLLRAIDIGTRPLHKVTKSKRRNFIAERIR